MSEKSDKQIKCSDTTNLKDKSFTDAFAECYNMLGHGEKKLLHRAVIEITNPPIAAGTVRGYCADPNKIPEKSREWYFKAMTSLLCFELEKKIDAMHESVQALSEKLLTELKNLKDGNL